ncbi:MAG: hypothetical protein WD067_04125 [Gaiellaceae bacterium]
MEAKRLEYEGPVYIRPIGRGIVLENTDRYLDEEIEAFVGASLTSGWSGSLRIVVEKTAEKASD